MARRPHRLSERGQSQRVCGALPRRAPLLHIFHALWRPGELVRGPAGLPAFHQAQSRRRQRHWDGTKPPKNSPQLACMLRLRCLQGGCTNNYLGQMAQGDCLLLSRNCTLPAGRSPAPGAVSGAACARGSASACCRSRLLSALHVHCLDCRAGLGAYACLSRRGSHQGLMAAGQLLLPRFGGAAPHIHGLSHCPPRICRRISCAQLPRTCTRSLPHLPGSGHPRSRLCMCAARDTGPAPWYHAPAAISLPACSSQQRLRVARVPQQACITADVPGAAGRCCIHVVVTGCIPARLTVQAPCRKWTASARSQALSAPCPTASAWATTAWRSLCMPTVRGSPSRGQPVVHCEAGQRQLR